MDKKLRLAWAKWDFVSNNIIELHTFGGQRSLWRTNRSWDQTEVALAWGLVSFFFFLGWWLFIISHNLESLGKESQEGTVWIRVASGHYHYHIKWTGKTLPHCEWRGWIRTCVSTSTHIHCSLFLFMGMTWPFPRSSFIWDLPQWWTAVWNWS